MSRPKVRTEARLSLPVLIVSHSFAYMEMSLTLAKLHYLYDLTLVNPLQEWESMSHLHVQWWKPTLKVRFQPARTGGH